VKNGVYEAGGIPLELPAVSLGETLLRPTAMLWRNMAAMATEKMLRVNPIDGVVLLGDCDKTIPSLFNAPHPAPRTGSRLRQHRRLPHPHRRS
jgi:dihydroxyacid dehydratase/phosphogluconate dehydratase